MALDEYKQIINLRRWLYWELKNPALWPDLNCWDYVCKIVEDTSWH